MVSIFVPFPYAAGDHQYYNALEFQQEGLGIVVRQNNLYRETLFNFIDKLNQLDSSGTRVISKISSDLIKKIQSDGAESIIAKIYEF